MGYVFIWTPRGTDDDDAKVERERDQDLGIFIVIILIGCLVAGIRYLCKIYGRKTGKDTADQYAQEVQQSEELKELNVPAKLDEPPKYEDCIVIKK